MALLRAVEYGDARGRMGKGKGLREGDDRGRRLSVGETSACEAPHVDHAAERACDRQRRWVARVLARGCRRILRHRLFLRATDGRGTRCAGGYNRLHMGRITG